MVRKKIDIKDKKLFLDFVYLTEMEYAVLCEKFGKQIADELVQDLNDGIGSKGYKYESHYYAILVWARRAGKKAKGDAAIGAASEVIEALKNPLAGMPDEEKMKRALYAMLTEMKTNWPGLRARLKDDATMEAEIRKRFMKSYK